MCSADCQQWLSRPAEGLRHSKAGAVLICNSECSPLRSTRAAFALKLLIALKLIALELTALELTAFKLITFKLIAFKLIALQLLPKLYRSVFTLPQAKDWVVGLILLLGYALIALLMGQRSSLLRWQPVASPRTIASTLALALIVPALMEETLFRVLLLPKPEYAYFYGWAVWGLVLFILAHPLNALLFFPHRRDTFFNPHFLALTGLLGLICTIAYQQSESLWLPVLLHWIPVGVWLLLWGGLERMSPQVSPQGATAPQGEEWRQP